MLLYCLYIFFCILYELLSAIAYNITVCFLCGALGTPILLSVFEQDSNNKKKNE